jgi:hypothetical protein
VLAEQHLAFRNLGDLRFEDVSAAWGLNQKGSASAPRRRPGRRRQPGHRLLELPRRGVTLLRNDWTRATWSPSTCGAPARTASGWATVSASRADSGVQVRQLVLARGYMLSSSEPMLHFGLGDDAHPAPDVVTWPSGHVPVVCETWRSTGGSRSPSRRPGRSARPPRPRRASSPRSEPARLLAALAGGPGRRDRVQQPLLPMRQNRRGPALAVGDLERRRPGRRRPRGTPSDPCGSSWGPGRPILAFRRVGAAPAEGPLDDGPALLFDADGDGRKDLLVTKGGNSLPAGSRSTSRGSS